MSELNVDPEALRRVGAPWRVAGVALVLLAAPIIVFAKARDASMHSPLMIVGFAILAVGWILAFIGIYVRTRHHARRLKEAE